MINLALSKNIFRLCGNSIPLFLQLLEQYKNVEFYTPYQHAMSATRSCLEVTHWSNDEKLKAMEGDVLLGDC